MLILNASSTSSFRVGMHSPSRNNYTIATVLLRFAKIFFIIRKMPGTMLTCSTQGDLHLKYQKVIILLPNLSCITSTNTYRVIDPRESPNTDPYGLPRFRLLFGFYRLAKDRSSTASGKWLCMSSLKSANQISSINARLVLVRIEYVNVKTIVQKMQL